MEEAAKCVHEPRRPAVTAKKVPRTASYTSAASAAPEEINSLAMDGMTDEEEAAEGRQPSDQPNDDEY